MKNECVLWQSLCSALSSARYQSPQVAHKTQLIWFLGFFFPLWLYLTILATLAAWLFFEHIRHIPTSWFLHVVFPLPELFCPNILMAILSFSSGFTSNIVSVRWHHHNFNPLSWYSLTWFLAYVLPQYLQCSIYLLIYCIIAVSPIRCKKLHGSKDV